MKIIILFVLFLTFISCTSQERRDEKELMNCVTDMINKNASEIYGKTEVNFYFLMNNVEKILIEDKLLEDSNQNDYIKLIKDIQNKDIDVKKVYKKVVSFLESNKYDLRDFMNISIVFGVCHNKILINENNRIKSTISAQYQILSELKAQGFDNYKLLEKLITKTKKGDFSKIVYKSPVILLTIINMDYQVNGVPKRAKFN